MFKQKLHKIYETQNKFYFGLVKVITKFEKNTKKRLSYSSLYEEQEYAFMKIKKRR